jgi:hypothetical protein
MQNKFLALGLFFILTLSSAMAGQTTLGVVTRTDGSLTANLILLTDTNDDITGMKVTISDGTIINIRPSELAGRGKVLNKKMGVDVLVLKARNLDLKQGGIFILDYLKKYNLIGSNVRATLDLELVRNKQGWQLLSEGKAIREMKAQVTSTGIQGFTLK